MSKEQQDRVEPEAGVTSTDEVLTSQDATSISETSNASSDSQVEIGNEEQVQEGDQLAETSAVQPVSGRKRGRRRGKPANIDEIMPKPSYWPFALALALVFTLLGIIIHPIVIGVGVVLIIVAVMGWALERR